MDPTTGDRTIISKLISDPADDMDIGRGVGPAFVIPRGIAVEDDGSLVVVDYFLDAVVRVDPDYGIFFLRRSPEETGNRMIISDDSTGDGPDFATPRGIAVQDDGSLVVVDSGLASVVRVDRKTGERTIISDNEMGMGPDFVSPFGIAVQDDGSLVVVDSGTLMRWYGWIPQRATARSYPSSYRIRMT